METEMETITIEKKQTSNRVNITKALQSFKHNLVLLTENGYISESDKTKTLTIFDKAVAKHIGNMY